MENRMKWLLVGVFGLLLAMAFLNVPLDVKQYGKSLRSTLTGAVALETSGVANPKDSETIGTKDSKEFEHKKVKVPKYVASETSEADSETSETEDSETSEAEGSEASEVKIAKTSEADDLKMSEADDTEVSQTEDPETSEAEGSETEDSETSESEDSETSESEDSETAEAEDSGVSEAEDSEMLKADTEESQTEDSETSEAEGSETEAEGSETSEAEGSETSETEGSETLEAEDSEASEAEGSETSETEGSGTSETEGSGTSETEGSELSEAEGSELSEAEGSELSEAEDLELTKADNSETPDEDGSKMSETPLENFPFVLTENINMSRILMDSVTKKKGKDKVYCLSEDDEPYTGFALLTPYRSGSSMDVKAEDVIPSGCNPVILWHLVRHGSNGPHMIDRRRFDRRLPVLRKQILKSHKDQQGYLCDKDVALINGWKPTDMLYGDATLSDEGKEEMTGIASRFRNAFSGFLKKDYFNLPGIRPGKGTKRNFGNGQHNMRSMKAYNKGMYGKYARFVVLRGMPARFLEYFDHCPNYIREVMQLDKKLKPYHGFMSGSYMKLVLENVAKRVGFAVSVTDVRSMYNTCRYYYAWYKDKVSPWCSVFTPDDLKTLEYWEDLRVYSDQGPVYEITSKQACELGKEVMDLFGNRLKNNSAEPYLTQYIVNYETLVTFITLMGIFSEQEPIDEASIPDSRVWKTTEFAGYGGNLALFLSSCGDDSFWVSALVNERPIQLPGCNSTLGCTWDEFAQYYDYLNDCDFSEICGSRRGIYLSKSDYWHDQAKQENWS